MVSAMARTKVVLPTPPLAFITVMLLPIGCCNPQKPEATPAPHIHNGATKENLWRPAETCLVRRSRRIGTSTLSKPASLRGDVAGIGSWRRKCTSNPARTNQLVCAHTSPWVARARVPQLWRTAATGSTQSEAQQQH